jgi:hypothetical protein
VAVQTLNAFEADLSPAEAYPAAQGGARSPREAAEFAESMEQLSDSPAAGIHCFRGVLFMIGLEAVAAFGLYGIWHARHLFR